MDIYCTYDAEYILLRVQEFSEHRFFAFILLCAD